MVVISLKETEITLLCSILSNYTTESRTYEILRIFDKFRKGIRSRLLKKAIDNNIIDFKKLNKIRDLGVYKKK